MKLKIHFKPMSLDVDTDWLRSQHSDELMNNDTVCTDFNEWLEKEGYTYLLNDCIGDEAHNLKVKYAEITEGGA